MPTEAQDRKALLINKIQYILKRYVDLQRNLYMVHLTILLRTQNIFSKDTRLFHVYQPLFVHVGIINQVK